MTMTVAIMWLGIAIEALIAAQTLFGRSEPMLASPADAIGINYVDYNAIDIPDNIVFMMPPPPPPPGAPGGGPPGGPWGGSNGYGNYGGYWGGYGGYGYGYGAWGANGLTPGGEKGGKVARIPKTKRSLFTRFAESLERLFR